MFLFRSNHNIKFVQLRLYSTFSAYVEHTEFSLRSPAMP